MSTEERAQATHLDRAIREAVRSDPAPDLLQRVRARVANPTSPRTPLPDVHAARAPEPQPRRWLAAAVVVLGAGALIAVALERAGGEPSTSVVAPQDPQPAKPVRAFVKTAEQLSKVSPDTTHLRVLRITAADFVRLVPELPKLEELDLDGLDGARMESLTVAVLNKVGTFGSLRVLDLPGRPELRDAWLQPLTGLPRLERINLSHAQIGEAGVAHLASLPSLRWLDVSMNQVLTDAALARVIAGAPGLQRLSVAGCGLLTSAGVQKLQSLRQLKHLDVSWVRGADMFEVMGSPPLPPFRAGWRQWAERWSKDAVRPTVGVDDAAVAALTKIASLRYLNLSGCRAIRRNGFELLGATQMSDLRLDDLPELPANLSKVLPKRLTNISLARSSITDASLRQLAQTMLLVELRIPGCRSVTDRGLRAVLARHQLFSLDIGGCRRLTKASLEPLLAQKKLFELRVSELAWIDDVAVKQLRGLPRLDFIVRS